MSIKVWFLYQSLHLSRSLAKRGIPPYDPQNPNFEIDLMHALESRKRWDFISKIVTFVSRYPPDIEQSIQFKDGVRTLIISPTNPGNGVILYLHGGGWRLPIGSIHTAYAANLAKSTGKSVWIVDYSLCPEYPFPAALLEVARVYQAILSEGYNPNSVSIIGDSAGGNLALALMLMLKNERTPLPAAVVSLSPATDAYMFGKSFTTKANVDPVLISELGRPAYASYMRGESPDNPLISPLYGDLSGFPPLLILVGGREILLDDSVKFAEKARKAGVDVTLDVHDEMFHSYPLFYEILEEAKLAMGKVAFFIQAKSG